MLLTFAVLAGVPPALDARGEISRPVSWRTVGTSIHSSVDRDELRAALPELTKINTRGEPIYRIEVGDIALEKSRWISEILAEHGSRTVKSDSYSVSRRQPDGRWLILIDDPGVQ